MTRSADVRAPQSRVGQELQHGPLRGWGWASYLGRRKLVKPPKPSPPPFYLLLKPYQ